MRLSEITVEDLRADHDAFVKKMREVSQAPPAQTPCDKPYDRPHDPNWREKLRSRSPFDL